MKVFGIPLKERIKRLDPILFGASFFLSLMSILTILGSVENFGRSKLVMQVAMTVVGLVAVFVLANTDYKFFIDRFYIVMFLGSVFLLAITLLFGISGINMETENRSWITIPGIGISIQPSEFVKITFLCTFSKHLDAVKDKLNRPLTLLLLMAHAGAIVGLILLSGDLGVALVYMGIILVMLFCAGLSGWYFLGAAVSVVVAFPFLWDFLKPYQQNRIIYGFQPELDPLDVGRQPLMSREVIARGGLFGKGLFEGGMYEDLTASHTDFIFATVCEKFGFVGGALVVVALAVLVVRLFYLSFKCRETVGKLICCGCAAMIIIQTLENLWMCLALVPVVGITLPFMSAGGSSVLAIYIIMGLAHSVSAHEKKFYFSREL
ncbi:MAG: FtsW/RodA/SpoVE family cell cycle protein [Clostridia bacterium]|nr:FtsW/RodA/SpoVE family cell cycle protein [Clostridia bacterium]